MDELKNKPEAQGDGQQWAQGPAECWICGHRYRAVYPYPPAFKLAECPQCHYMASVIPPPPEVQP